MPHQSQNHPTEHLTEQQVERAIEALDSILNTISFLTAPPLFTSEAATAMDAFFGTKPSTKPNTEHTTPTTEHTSEPHPKDNALLDLKNFLIHLHNNPKLISRVNEVVSQSECEVAGGHQWDDEIETCNRCGIHITEFMQARLRKNRRSGAWGAGRADANHTDHITTGHIIDSFKYSNQYLNEHINYPNLIQPKVGGWKNIADQQFLPDMDNPPRPSAQAANLESHVTNPPLTPFFPDSLWPNTTNEQ